jgi:hypothetical protein
MMKRGKGSPGCRRRTSRLRGSRPPSCDDCPRSPRY